MSQSQTPPEAPTLLYNSDNAQADQGGKNETPDPPTEEQILAIINSQLRIKNMQLKLQTVNTALAESRVNELKALTMIAQITNMPRGGHQGAEESDEEPHAITPEDIERYPILTGMRPGDLVLMSEVVTEQDRRNRSKPPEAEDPGTEPGVTDSGAPPRQPVEPPTDHGPETAKAKEEVPGNPKRSLKKR